MSGTPLLSVRHVSRQFGGVNALNDVSFEIAAGEVVGLIGPNGAGKTTLFNLISGVFKPSGGEIFLSGKRISGLRADLVCQAGIGRTFQSASLLPGTTCWENVYVASLFRRADPESTHTPAERAADALEMCGLSGITNKLVEEITTGEAKRLEIARAYATRPKVLMTDEAVAGLNAKETDQIVAILRTLNKKGITIIFVEHDVRAVLSLVERLIVLGQGTVLADGEPKEVARLPRVIEAYLGSRYAQAS